MIKTSSVIILPAIDKAAQGAGPGGNEAGRRIKERKEGSWEIDANRYSSDSTCISR